MSQAFADLGLRAELVRAVAEEGYTVPTPVQAQSIPVILAGRDVLAGAQTGTGKTAGFTLPMLQRLAVNARGGTSPARHPLRALVVTPTRELAAQVEESVRTYGRHLALRSTLVYGGVGMQPQVDALRRGVDILVATPGRLLDHAQQKTVDLSKIEILVLDEADRMLDMGFIRDIKRILALLPAKRQNLLFSATFSDEIRGLATSLLHDPAQVEVARRNADCELVTQRVCHVAKDHKRGLLAHLVSSGDWQQVLVFTRTKHGANRLAEQLCKDGIEATAIHGNKSQPQRVKALAGFKNGSVRVLVATDIAARGLDIEQLPHVVNYELPNVPEDYVHRIGRTGRAGSTGEALSLVCAEERPLLADIEKLLKRRIETVKIEGYTHAAPAPESSPVQNDARPAQGGQRRGEGQSRQPREGQRRGQGRQPQGGREQPVRQHAGGEPARPPREGQRHGQAARGPDRNGNARPAGDAPRRSDAPVHARGPGASADPQGGRDRRPGGNTGHGQEHARSAGQTRGGNGNGGRRHEHGRNGQAPRPAQGGQAQRPAAPAPRHAEAPSGEHRPAAQATPAQRPGRGIGALLGGWLRRGS